MPYSWPCCYKQSLGLTKDRNYTGHALYISTFGRKRLTIREFDILVPSRLSIPENSDARGRKSFMNVVTRLIWKVENVEPWPFSDNQSRMGLLTRENALLHDET